MANGFANGLLCTQQKSEKKVTVILKKFILFMAYSKFSVDFD